jgi:hypothetical protein
LTAAVAKDEIEYRWMAAEPIDFEETCGKFNRH